MHRILFTTATAAFAVTPALADVNVPASSVQAGGLMASSDSAGPFGPVPRAQVSHGDLDLSTREGRRILERRIRTALHEVCAAHLDSAVAYFTYSNCLEEANQRVRPVVAEAIECASGRRMASTR